MSCTFGIIIGSWDDCHMVYMDSMGIIQLIYIFVLTYDLFKFSEIQLHSMKETIVL